MSATGERVVDSNLLNEGIVAAVGVVTGSVAGWLYAAVRKLSKADLDAKLGERDKLVIEPMRNDINEIKREQKLFVTREHLKEIMDDYRATNDAQHLMLRSDLARIQTMLEKRN